MIEVKDLKKKNQTKLNINKWEKIIKTRTEISGIEIENTKNQ